MGTTRPTTWSAPWAGTAFDGGAGEDVLDYSGLEFEGDLGVFLDMNQWVDGPGPLDPGQMPAPPGYLGQFARNIEILLGSTADDQIFGTEGAETIDAGGGRDTIDGRGGDDTLYGRASGAALDGGEGRDTLSYALVSEGITASLTTGRGGALDRLSNLENLSGSLFDDVLEGDENSNVLFGNLGLDEIHGQGGDDTFTSAGDGDIFHGGEGNDVADYRISTLGPWSPWGLGPSPRPNGTSGRPAACGRTI